MSLRRLILTSRPSGLKVRTLYRSKSGPNPGTKARRREAAGLTRAGLLEALEAFDGSAGEDVEDLGTSGYEVREDVLHLPAASPATAKLVKGA